MERTITDEARETLRLANEGHYGNTDTLEDDLNALLSALNNLEALDRLDIPEEEKEQHKQNTLVGLIINSR